MSAAAAADDEALPDVEQPVVMDVRPKVRVINLDGGDRQKQQREMAERTKR